MVSDPRGPLRVSIISERRCRGLSCVLVTSSSLAAHTAVGLATWESTSAATSSSTLPILGRASALPAWIVAITAGDLWAQDVSDSPGHADALHVIVQFGEDIGLNYRRVIPGRSQHSDGCDALPLLFRVFLIIGTRKYAIMPNRAEFGVCPLDPCFSASCQLSIRRTA